MAPTCTQMDVEPIPPSQPQSFRNTINGISGINGLAIELSEAEQMALSRHGMPRVTDNMIECCDRNWVSEMAKTDVKWNTIPASGDVEAMRRWSKTSYHEYNHKPQCTLLRKEVPVIISNVTVCYDGTESFGIRVYDPSNGHDAGPRPVLIMYHGGGWIHSDPTCDEDLAIFFASDLRAVVFSVDYRLAPEHDVRSIHNDCFQAVEWVIENAATYRIDTSKIALWGCSAGGHLAATVAMRDAQTHSPSRIKLVSLVVPVTCHPDVFMSDYAATRSMQTRQANLDIYNTALQRIRQIFDHVAPQSSFSSTNLLVSPLLAHPVPMSHAAIHITVAGCDFLCDQGIAYAVKLRDAGIHSTLEIIPGVPHGFVWAVASNATKQWTANQVQILDKVFKTST